MLLRCKLYGWSIQISEDDAFEILATTYKIPISPNFGRIKEDAAISEAIINVHESNYYKNIKTISRQKSYNLWYRNNRKAKT